MSELTNSDFKTILEYYNQPMPKSARLIKKNAEKIIANKLCKCIKKINTKIKSKNEARSIGICTKTIINNKGFSRGKFKCKRNFTIKLKKNKQQFTRKNNH
jgi:hypothetical protein